MAVPHFAALFALALLPGLLVVRAPWSVVSALSLAFWVLAAWWLPLAGPGRSRVLAASVLAFGLLALLRLMPKHEVPPPPGWAPPPAPHMPSRPGLPPLRLRALPSLAVVAAALALLAPVPLWHHAPGPRLAFQTTTARLLVWRDGVPATAEPLLPLSPVGAHAPALATLAADVSHLSGLDPARSLLLVVATGASLLLVGLFALHATWAPPLAAALGALLGLAAAPWPDLLTPWGEGEALLALALALPAAALLLGHASRSSAVAAAMLLAAAALAQPVLAALVGLAAAVPVARRQGPGRPCLALGLALALAAPGLWPLAQALSLREAAGTLVAARPGELPAAALGLLLAALAPLALLRLEPLAAGARRPIAVAVALVATALLVARVHGWIASGQLSGATRAALARATADTAPLDMLCAPEGVRDWVPALASRAAGDPGPWIPRVYAEEWARRPRRACAARLEALPPP
jgi:hypothetical protein